jgi:zinc protease
VGEPTDPQAETTFMPPLRPMPLPPRYEMLGELGRGGMGIVYKARDRETGEVVAIKVLKPEIASETHILERFKSELRLAHQITHRNVARLYEFHRTGESVYLTMEFVEGESLRALLERAGKLEVPQALEMARQLGAGLAEAHRQSIAHRDLKPENIMLGPQGELKVMDFGISRSFAADVTATGAIIGTPAYMAPEQAEGRPVDHRTDIYAFGLILYEMFTGAAAFTGDTAVTLALKQIRERPKPPRAIEPSLPKHIEAAILRCLEKDPAKRFQSVDDVIRALEQAPPARGTQTVRWASLRWSPPRWLWALPVIALALAGWWWWHGRPSDSVRLPVETFSLANGLRVVLSADHTSPTFALAVAYHAGLRYEQPGHTGVAHLIEHLMFQGSANVGRGEHMSLIAGAGGTAGSITDTDLTFFYETLPANQVELALFLEADRMRNLAITPEGLSAARAVLLEERALAEGNPYARARLRATALSFDNFVNQRTRYPEVEELNAATADDVAQFYRAHYTPSDAGLILVGDFEPSKAREMIRKYFEPIPAREAAARPNTVEPQRAGEKREILTDPAMPGTEVLISWRIPGATNPDWFAVKRLGEVLGANDATRLPAALVKSAGVASSVNVNLEESAGPNLLTAEVLVAPGKDPAQAEKLVYEEIERIAREGVPKEELDRVSTDALRRRAFQLITTSNRALLLAEFLIGYGQVDAINQWENEESRLSGSDVQRMAQKYFARANRTVLIVNPGAGGRP